MSAHNIQLFSGAVEIPDDLRVVSLTVEDGLVELGANGAFANVGYVMNNPGGSNAAVYYDKISDQLRVVHTDFGGKEGPNTVTIKNEDITMNVSGNVEALFYRGDGGLLSNLVSDLQSVTAVEANSDQMIILSNATALWANVGNVLVEGNVTAGEFHGDGGWLTNVQTTFEETIVNGNATSNIVEFNNALAFVTTGNVGIQNVAPLGDLSIGANVVFDDDATDILKVQGNINCEVITIGQWVLGGGGSQGLQQITDTGHDTDVTVEFDNTTTAFKTVAKAAIGTSTPSSDAMLHVDGHVRLGGPADTPDNENMFVRAAGALNIIANHSNTDNTTSNLVMKAGEINAASITLAGAVTDDDRQRIVFKTREVEALTIDRFGNANFVSNVVVGTGAKFIGDGSGLTGLVSDLQSVSVGGATTNQTIKFTNATEGANITSNLYVGSNLHLDDVTLAAASVTLQGVTTNGATTTDAITITDTTQATTTSTGALKVSGGIAAAMDIRAANVVVNRVGVGLTAGANPDPAHLVEVDGNVKATNVICESLTLDSVALQTLYSLDQVVNVNNTTSNIVIISNTTPSTSLSTGCLQLSGGLGVNGNVYAQEFVNTNAGGWRLTHTHSTRPTVNGATVGGELTGGNGDVETGFLRLSGGGSTTGTGAPKSYIDICGASASTDFANNITFGIKGSEKVRLTDVGLGLGTVSPGYLLDVHGAANVGTLTTTGRLGLGTATPLTPLHISSTNEITSSPAGSAVSQMRYGSTNSTVLFGVSSTAGHISAYDTSNFSTHRNLCLNADGGNVGLGTTSPIGKLQVDIPNASAATATWDSTKVVFGDIANGNSQGLGFGVTTNSHASMISLAPGVAWRGLSYYSAWHKWYINNVEKMTLDASGNVGIGTGTPTHKLNVKATSGDAEVHIQAQGNDGGDAIIYFNGSATNQRKCAILSSNVSPASWCKQDLHFCHNTSGNYDDVTIADSKMVITNPGNVGIGTNNPGAPLEVKLPSNDGSLPILSLIRDGVMSNTSGDTFRAIEIKTQQTVYSPVTHASINLINYNTIGSGQFGLSQPTRQDTGLGFSVIQNGSAVENALVIRDNGNVGIGTTSPNVSLHVQDSTPSQVNNGLDGLFVANSGSSGSFFNIQSATGNGRVFAVTNTGVGKFDGGVSGSAADYAEMFEWIDGNPDDEDRRGLVVELVGGDKIQVATSTTSESNIIGVVSAEPCVLAGESTFHWTSKWLKDDFGSYQMEDYEAWQYSKGSGEPTVVPVEGTEPGDVPEDAVKVTAKRRIFNPDYDDTIEYVPRSQRKEWSPVGVVGRLRVKKGQPARSSWVKLKDVSEMIEEWFIR